LVNKNLLKIEHRTKKGGKVYILFRYDPKRDMIK